MIKLDSFKKYNILYKNYINQFSETYLIGSPIYVGDSLNHAPYIKKIYIEHFIKTYSNSFIKLYINNNKIHNFIYDEKLCIICLENLNEYIVNVCHKCNVICHKECIDNFYKTKHDNICPVCLKSEEYYLNILKNKNILNNNVIYIGLLNKLFYIICIFSFIIYILSHMFYHIYFYYLTIIYR